MTEGASKDAPAPNHSARAYPRPVEASLTPMRFGYADPPYIGQAKRHYSADPKCAEVDHVELIARLNRDYPDGWALSCHTPSLGYLLSLAPKDVRVCAWVKPFASFKPGVRVAYAWEPVLVRGGRGRMVGRTVRDWVSANIVLKAGLSGAKPPEFCRWLMEVLGVQPGDEFHDLFPGTGRVGDVAREVGAVVL